MNFLQAFNQFIVFNGISNLYYFNASAAGGSPSPNSMTTASVTSGTAPLFVFFDAIDAVSSVDNKPWTSQVTQPQASDPNFASVFYLWDFGDTGAGTWNLDGMSRNTDIGFTAAHVYDTPGNYTVTLSTIDYQGTVTVYTQNITVSAFTGTSYYVAASGSDSNNGTTQGTAFLTFSRGIQAASGNTAVYFRSGGVFSANSTATITSTSGIIGKYGTGTAPIIGLTADGISWFIQGSNWVIQDLIVSGIGAGSGGFGVGAATDAVIQNQLYYRVSSTNFINGIGWSFWTNTYANPHKNMGLVQCASYRNRDNNFYVGGRQLGILDCSAMDANDSHSMRIWQAHKATIKHTLIRNPSYVTQTNARHVLKLHGPHETTPVVGRPKTYGVHISNNELSGGPGGQWCIAIRPQDQGEDERLKVVMFENNIIRDSSRAAIDVFIMGSYNVTCRNNLCIKNTQPDGYELFHVRSDSVVGQPAPSSIMIYNNTLYTSATKSEIYMISYANSMSSMNGNNLICAPNVTTVGFGTDQDGTSMEIVASGLVNPPTDLHLAPGSLAIGAGDGHTFTRRDYDGETRATTGTGTTDCGAYLYTP
jgi:hypothetical protein